MDVIILAPRVRASAGLLLALVACGRTDMVVPVGEESGSSSSTGGSTDGSSGPSFSSSSGTGDTTEAWATSEITSAAATSSTTEDPSTSSTSSTTEDPSTSSTTEDPSTSSTTEDPNTSSTSSTTEDPNTSSTTEDPSTSSTSSTTDTDTDTGPPIECGNGILELGEECDPGLAQIGPDQACVPGCLLNVCGDGMDGPAEECDDANADDEDACHTNCMQARAVFVALGGNHTCARIDNGSVRCWGNGNNGRTGHGDLLNIGDDEPAAAAGVVSLGGPVQEVVTGLSHTCVRYGDGAVRCFGRALEGQLGYGDTLAIGDDELPSTAGLVPLGGPVQSVVSRGGSFHSCALRVDGQVRCWGHAGMGRLGVPGLAGNVGNDEPADAIPAVSVGGAVVQLTTGAEHTCVRIDDGSVRCWGSNASGQLGRGVAGNVGDDEDPSSVAAVSIGAPVTSITAGFFHTCALLEGGAVRCWGRGNNGRLGQGDTAWVGLANQPSDVPDVDVGGVAVQIAAGNAHTCALLVGGTVRCWGWAGQGQLGYGTLHDVGDDETPAFVGDVPVGAAVVQIAADGNHTCALLESGQVRCWGNGGEGRLGYGNLATVGDDETPAMVGDVPLFP